MNRKFINAFFAAALLLGGATVFSSCKDTNEDMNTQLEADINRNAADLANLTARVDALKSCDCTAIEVDLSEIENRLDGLDSATDELIEALNAEITALENKAAVSVTSLLIQAVENPVFGSISLPLDVKSNMLLTYYGAFDAEFPNVGTSKNVGVALEKSEVTPEQISGEVTALTKDADGNDVENYLGTVYTTINPSSVDVNNENLSLSIVNSQDENYGGITLENTAASEKVLEFGLGSRADNGFYESTAVAGNLDEIKVDLSGLGEGVKELLSDRSQADAKALLELVVAKIRANKFPALGIKAEYSWDEVSNFTITKNSDNVWTVDEGYTTENKSAATYSEYAIAAAAFKPLSFEFLQGNSFAVLPTIPDLGDLELSKEDFDIHIEAPDKSSFTANISFGEDGDVVFTVPAQTIVITGADGNPTGDVVTVEATEITAKDLEDLQAKMQESLQASMDGSYNAIVEMVNSINEQIDNVFKKVNDKIAAASDKVQPWFDRANEVISKVNSLLEDPNNYLQVCALYENGEKIGRFSNSSAVPTYFPGGGASSLSTILTTYNLETVVPAYKKYYAVYKLSDNSVVAANIIPGTQSRITISGLEDGEKYQLVYQALDYHGITSTQNFYFQIGE